MGAKVVATFVVISAFLLANWALCVGGVPHYSHTRKRVAEPNGTIRNEIRELDEQMGWNGRRKKYQTLLLESTVKIYHCFYDEWIDILSPIRSVSMQRYPNRSGSTARSFRKSSCIAKMEQPESEHQGHSPGYIGGIYRTTRGSRKPTFNFR